ncbi:hypothetical protein [Methylomonas sp. UP202]|uniref:hypothetical protein n=1 Tax=Methylomonas sp. UP202 TaxID=3040943 RepID=UPI0024796F05|nr:hypothetical protein [Methylomonas sp. UP202]WGS83804.1 hypothetical protein QC632_12085 [Methylomonas sp. UP202]
MTPDETLIELLERLGSMRGAPVLIDSRALRQWPTSIVAAMIQQGLLSKASPAKSAVCTGCERECMMPVHLMSNATGHVQALMVCDKRDDISRVPVAIECLEQRQASGDSLANMLAALLDLRKADKTGSETARWEIGLLKGAKHTSHLVLTADAGLLLSLAGHTVAVVEVLTFDDQAFKVDKRKLTRFVDQPALGGGDVESAAQRKERLKKRVQVLTNKGIKAFLKTVAEEEGISVSRLKQLLAEDDEPKKSKS